jgi:hypothetical protein
MLALIIMLMLAMHFLKTWRDGRRPVPNIGEDTEVIPSN